MRWVLHKCRHIKDMILVPFQYSFLLRNLHASKQHESNRMYPMQMHDEVDLVETS